MCFLRLVGLLFIITGMKAGVSGTAVASSVVWALGKWDLWGALQEAMSTECSIEEVVSQH